MKLLSIGTNAKTSKSDGFGEYLTAIMYLAPHTEAGGKSLCPFSTEGCREACLYTAGRGAMPSVQDARVSRAQLWNSSPHHFLARVSDELVAFQKKCLKLGVKPAVRLNGTSDVLWERTWLLGHFEHIAFYDYTKIPSRMTADLPDNYHLTFSADENTTDTDILFLTGNQKNVAIVFNELPNTYLGIPVINGDTHDLRFTDPKGVIVGLTAKGKAKKDTSGFVRIIT